jgi:hypothetical protein
VGEDGRLHKLLYRSKSDIKDAYLLAELKELIGELEQGIQKDIKMSPKNSPRFRAYKK